MDTLLSKQLKEIYQSLFFSLSIKENPKIG